MRGRNHLIVNTQLEEDLFDFVYRAFWLGFGVSLFLLRPTDCCDEGRESMSVCEVMVRLKHKFSPIANGCTRTHSDK